MWELIESLKQAKLYDMLRKTGGKTEEKVNISLGINEIEIGREHGRGF